MKTELQQLNTLYEALQGKDWVDPKEIALVVVESQLAPDKVCTYLKSRGLAIKNEEKIAQYIAALEDDDESDDGLPSEDELDSTEEDDKSGEEDRNFEEIEAISSGTNIYVTGDVLRMYLHEIGSVRLLNEYEEVRLAMWISQGLYERERLARDELVPEHKRMTPQEVAHCQKAITKGNWARNKLNEHNFKLVVSIAKKSINHGLTLEDLIQEGNKGLMSATEKFNPTLGWRFSTYASWWIRQAISRAIADHGRTIRTPVHMVETINKLYKVSSKLAHELNREPTTREIADKMGITPERVSDIQRYALEPLNLDTPIGTDDDTVQGDLIGDHYAISATEQIIQEEYIREIYAALAALTPREEKVIRMRRGLDDGIIYTLEQVGAELNVTRERVRQIERKAEERLKQIIKRRKLQSYR